MVVPEFKYHRPKTMYEAYTLLTTLPGEVAVYGGGTEILVDLKMGAKRIDHLVALEAIEGMKRIEMEGEDLVIGAMVTPGALARSPLVREKFPEVAEVADVFAARQVGNRATIGGNIAAAVPSADYPPILLALRAVVEISGKEGERHVPLNRIFTGPRHNALAKGDVITEIRLPRKPAGSGGKYIKFGLRASGACSVVGVAVVVHLEGDKCKDVRIALGAVAPTPMLVKEAQDYLEDRFLDEKAISEVARIAGAACKPISDIRGSDCYRRDIVGTLTARALTVAVERARASVV